MLERNPGLKSRFQKTLHLADWEPQHCCEFLTVHTEKHALVLEKDALKPLSEGFSKLKLRPGWANARDVLAIFDDMLECRAMRIVHIEELTPTLTYADAEEAMTAFIEHRPERADVVIPEPMTPRGGKPAVHGGRTGHEIQMARVASAEKLLRDKEEEACVEATAEGVAEGVKEGENEGLGIFCEEVQDEYQDEQEEEDAPLRREALDLLEVSACLPY